jgi:cytidylate kinase
MPRDEGGPSATTTSRDYDDYKRYARCYGVDKDSDGRYFRVDYDRQR